MTTKSKRKETVKPAKLKKPAKARKTASTARGLKKTLRVMRSHRFVVSVPSPVILGAVVSGTDPCTCGHAPEEHGHDTAHPGSTACTVEGCDCIAYEADPGFNEED